jgi:Alcohol dehydrogenase GroES-like domain
VTNVKVGDRVAMEPGATCRKCEACKEGRYQVRMIFAPILFPDGPEQLCPDVIFAATPPTDGTLARYYRLPSDLAYPLPPNLSLEDGAMVSGWPHHISLKFDSVLDGTSFRGSPCCLEPRCFAVEPVRRRFWLWTRWTSMHGRRKSSWRFPCYRC